MEPDKTTSRSRRGHELTPYWAKDRAELFRELSSSPEGLGEKEARSRLARIGPNSVSQVASSGLGRLLLRQFENPLVLILVFAAGTSMVVREWTEALIVLAIVLGSTILGFSQEYRASQAMSRLRARLSLRSTVVRDGGLRELETSQLVPGDIVLLSAGNLVPADGIVLEARDFLVSQSALTGESFPVEKAPEPSPADAALGERRNVVFLGTSVRSGTARILIVATGAATELAAISTRLTQAEEETEFQRGIRGLGYLLTRIMIVIAVAVLTINLLLHRPLIESLLFAVALAVGLSPELLPAIMSVTLSAGARRMAAQGVIVRRLEAIENLGSADVLCTDKTGTLTRGVVGLTAAVDAAGEASSRVLRLALTNALLQTGIANPLDAAIIEARRAGMEDWTPPAKIDEISYDFLRKRLSIVVAADDSAGGNLIVTKGAFDEVLSCCTHVAAAAAPQLLDSSVRDRIAAFYEERGKDGFRVLGVASRPVADKPRYARSDEAGMVFEGFLLFFDPLKDGIAETVRSIAALGIHTKIITGDNRHVAAHVGRSIGLDPRRLLTGRQLYEMRDEALWRMAPRTDIFAEVDPQQKERVVRALQRGGHAVAYLGDGINDAPALKAADVGVSVEEAVDVARETADIVLLQRDLDVLRQGVVDGRRTFANTLKYIEITTSANFGNMISMALAAVFVPFLPLLAKQILLNNFLSDFPSAAISTDNVDPSATRRAQRWEIGRIWSFLLVFGLTSTVFDLATFYVLLRIFGAGEALFQTTWFVVSLMTELMVVLVLRTHRPAWRSAPSRPLLAATLGMAVVALALPFVTPVASVFGFVPIPAHLLTTGLLVVGLYIVATELIKWRYFARRRVRRIRARRRRTTRGRPRFESGGRFRAQ